MSDKRPRCMAEGPACPKCGTDPMYCALPADHDGDHGQDSSCGPSHWPVTDAEVAEWEALEVGE